MKKLVALSLALITVFGMISVATFAYFTDKETSSGNRMVAGTLDLKTNEADGVSRTLYATGMSPGATVGPITITLKNAGTTNGATLDIVFSYAESDDITNNVVNKTADATAAVLQVTALTYDGADLLVTLTDTNGNGYVDVQDLKNANLTGQIGLAAGAAKSFVIAVRLRSETGKDFQADGITVTMTFTLKQ